MQKFYNNNFYCWACDYSKITGEGNLARLFIKKNFNKFKIIEPKKLFGKSLIFNYKYFTPLVGIVICWFFYLRNKKTAYINYLPLWNSLIFLFLPPNTILGPITGGARFSKKSFFLIRKFIFPVLYKISERLILLRTEKPIFSTSLLKNYLSKKTIRISKFDYVFNYLNINKKKYKKKDFIIYHRNNNNKINLLDQKILKNIKKLNYKIYVVGDKLNLPYVHNIGIIGGKKLYSILKNIKYSICSKENIFSLFTLDCLNNNIKILIDKKYKNDILHFKNEFIFTSSNLKTLKKNLNEA